MKKTMRFLIVGLLLAVVLAVGTLPTWAEPVEYVFIEYVQGKGVMIRNSVLAAGGQIHFESQEDIGTRFVVELPLARACHGGTGTLSHHLAADNI